MTNEADPVAVLGELLARVEAGPAPVAESDLRGSRSFFDRRDYDEIEAVIADFGTTFERVAAAVEAAWGRPDYGDGDLHGDDVDVSATLAEELYWGGAVRLAAWRRGPGLFAYVAVQHADVELPVLLVMGARRWP